MTDNSRSPSRHARRRQPDAAKPSLRFTPTAWAKLWYFCHRGETEIGGFGISSADDLLRIEAFITVEQQTSLVSVVFDDTAVADHFDDQVDAGRKPEQFARVWLHTHPGRSPIPSATDEATFARVFGGCAWAVMFVLARSGDTFARLRFNTGPGGEILLPVSVDYDAAFEGSDHAVWEREYQANIHPEPLAAPNLQINDNDLWLDDLDREAGFEFPEHAFDEEVML